MICPLEDDRSAIVTVAHGGGGRAMHELLSEIIGPILDDPELCEGHDAAILPFLSGTIALTTDSFVVQPLFFPGGDIGSLAIHGTINDLAMQGARPLYISVGAIVEEGLSRHLLLSVFRSLAAAARQCGVRVVAGDTKVVERGRGDKLFLTTTGVGVVEQPLRFSPSRISEGDRIIINGDIGRHAIAVMAARAELTFTHPIESDSAPLWSSVSGLINSGYDLHAMRDVTRGGLAAVLNEIAERVHGRIVLEEDAIPIAPEVRHAADFLGLDPLHLACEGRFVMAVPGGIAERVIESLLSSNPESQPTIIGAVESCGLGNRAPQMRRGGELIIRTRYGGERFVPMPAGEVLPRIC